jgi:hypothetical protein
MLRTIATVSGVAIIASLTFIQVMSNGGFAATTTPLTVSVGVGLIVGSVATAIAWKGNFKLLAAMFVICMTSAELFLLLTSGERLVTSRDLISAPLVQASLARTAATKRVQDAIEAKQKVDAQVLSSASLSGCKVKCAELLTANTKAATEELNTARELLAKLPKVEASASPLADRLNISHTAFDLLLASLYSISGTLLGSTLIAFGSSATSAKSEQEQVAAFLVSALKPQVGSTVPQTALEAAYTKYCVTQKIVPLDYTAFTAQVTMLLAAANLAVINVSGVKAIVDVTLK